MPNAPVTLCVLLWAQDGQRDELVAYEDTVLALLPDHGGRVLERLRTHDEASAEPVEIHVLEFPSEAALDAYMHDERRSKLAERRNRAIARTEVFRVTAM